MSPNPNSARMRDLPSVDELLRTELATSIAAAAGTRHATRLARFAVAQIRKEIARPGTGDTTASKLFAAAMSRMKQAWAAEQLSGTRRVINATGVVIHTNLGRAPLSDDAVRAINEAASSCSLEYDLATGKRGRRGGLALDLITELTGAEDALIVNNCAAAAFFVLSAFAAGGDVVISRGELVEIGGDFRVPDVLATSGATLREVGTTNRTKLSDYERAITRRAKLVLRVHPSNYRIVGFTASPSLRELAELTHASRIMLYEDLGSGALIDLGLGEPKVSDSIKAGADIVTFSGDKLLGAAQAGFIVGRKHLIAKLRKHPLYRALRADKLTYAAIEATLLSYRRGTPNEDVPVARMLSATRAQIRRRAKAFVAKIFAISNLRAEISDPKARKKKKDPGSDLRFEIINGVSATGGGAAPGVELETALITVSHQKKSAVKLEKELRDSDPPVIARIVDDRVVIDLRTVSGSEEGELAAAIRSLD